MLIKLNLLFFLLLQNPAEARVSFCAVGDILLDRGIRTTIEKNGVDYPFEQVSEFINGFDLAFCNLECPISARGASTGKIYCFRADTNFFTGVDNAGFNIFSLANNHTIDWGRNAFMDTKEIIEKRKLYAVGAGKNQEEARGPTIVRMNGLTFAFFAYVGMPLEGIVWAEDKPGPAQATIEEICKEIFTIREGVDFVVVSLHWGIEYQHTPMINQVQWGRKIIDAGADLIIGHHPHVLQSIEIYRNRFILYSLGNFVFDQHKLYQRQTGIFSCIFKKGRIDSVSFYPVLLENFRPGLVKDSAFEFIKEKIEAISSQYNTKFLAGDEQIFLTDSTLLLSFTNPIMRSRINKSNIIVYNNSVEMVDTNGFVTSTLTITPGEEIKDCCFIKDSASLHLFAIIGKTKAFRGDYLAQYRITDKKIIEEWLDKDRGYNPWKIITADIDSDSVPEICVGVYKKARFHPILTNRLFIYNWDGNYIYPKWFGSRLSMPFLDFDFFDIDNDGLDDLIALEINKDGTKRIMVYQWLGFGFSGYRELAKNLNETWLSNIDIDSLISNHYIDQKK
jgi:poly-gamma-glutamate synthesis protein (capsule biosynthesis protein)